MKCNFESKFLFSVFLFFLVFNSLKAIEFNHARYSGDLQERMLLNIQRLSETKYQPEHVFLTDEASGFWPGDTEGRTLLALVLEAQAAHQQPLYLQQIIDLIPEHLNAQGYMGYIYPDVIDEQQLSGNGWMLRALCEYYAWKKDEKVLPIIRSIAYNLFVVNKGFYAHYPISTQDRIKDVGEESGSRLNVVGRWKLSSDVGCVFIGMEGLIHAYQYAPSPELKEVIEEMIARFLEMPLLDLKAQTHASLTACRGLIRYAELENKPELIQRVSDVWKLYKAYGMTENYANYNWFKRYDTWTEPCAIVDSYMLAMQMWRHTHSVTYLNDAELIYLNALSHAQRFNGGFGCDNCPGLASKSNSLQITAQEAHWCCTMRGGEGLASLARYSIDTDRTGEVSFLQYHSGIFTIAGMNIEVKSEYPLGDVVKCFFRSVDPSIKRLYFHLPYNTKIKSIQKNGKMFKYTLDKGFIRLSNQFKPGDELVLQFDYLITVEKGLNCENTNASQFKVMRGPLLYGVNGSENSQIDQNSLKFIGTGIQARDVLLTPLYHKCDSTVEQSSGYKKQIIFN